MRALNCLLPSNWLKAALAATILWGLPLQVSAQVVQADGASAATGQVEQASYRGSGTVYSRDFGTPLRFSYHTEGYGTETGVVSLGTMKVFNLDGATWFLDGQGTMSDSFGGGFNAGVGYREMVNFNGSFDPDRILGASFWTDGQSTQADNFFTQLGFGLESLGESFDLRLNGSFPLDRQQDGDPTLIDFNTVTFSEHGLFSGLERVITDTAYDVVDGEFAKRVGDLDAWAYLGGYHLGGVGEDGTGYRIGFRGYALPDLLLGLQVTDDNIYSTNVVFNMTWFVGRTHKGNANLGVLADRFRDPVFRNDFVATTQSTRTQGATELTDTETNLAFNFIHVNSAAAAGGDGTYETPFRTLEEAEIAQADDAYIYLHGGSTFTPTETITLFDNVNLWSEGTNFNGDAINHVVDSVERGTVTLPETATGASALSAAVIDASGTGTDFLVLGDDNDVNNLTINGAMNAIVADSANANVNATEAAEELANAAANGINAPHLANIQINSATGTAITLNQITGTAIVENTVEINDAATGIHITAGEDGMSINAAINDSTGSSLIVEDRTGGIISYGGLITDGAADTDNADAIILQNNTDATVNFTDTITLNSTGTNRALFIDGNNTDSVFTFADLIADAVDGNTVEMIDGGTLTINDVNMTSTITNTGTGSTFVYDQLTPGTDDLATITVAAAITNTVGGNAVRITGHEDNNITFDGDISHTSPDSDGIELTNNTGGTIAFNGKITSDSGTGFGVNASGGGEDVTYSFANLDITTTTGTGFSVLDDGTLEVTSADGTNSVTTGGGQAIVLNGNGDGLTIGANNVTFDELKVMDGTGNTVVIADTDGTGQVIIGTGTTAGSSGTISTDGTAITVDNADNVAVSNLAIDNTGLAGTGNGIAIINQDGGSVSIDGVTIDTDGTGRGVNVGTGGPNTDGTITFADLEVNTVDGDAVTVEDNTGGTTVFNNLTAETSGTGAVVVLDNNDGATTTFNDMAVTATGTGNGFSATSKGTVAITGDTSVDINTGANAFVLDDVTIDSAGVAIDTVNVAAGTGDSVVLRDLAGANTVTIGSGTNPGDGGTISTSGTGILVDNADSVAIDQVTINNTTGDGFRVVNQNNGTVTSSGLDVTTTTGNGVVIGSTTVPADGNTAGLVTMTDTTITSGDGDALTVQNNTGGTYTFINTDATTTGAGDAVNVVSNTGATISFNGMDLSTTGTGNGFTATGGGTLTATGTNNIDTDDGVGLNINGMTIGGTGASFTKVDVDNSAVGGHGITITNPVGNGLIRVGASIATGNSGDGGTINTDGDAIQITGARNVVFNDVVANSVSDNAVQISHTSSSVSDYTFNNFTTTTVATSAEAIVLNDNGTGEINFILNESSINTVASDTAGFTFNAGANSGIVDISLTDNNFTANDSSAVSAAIGAGSNDVRFLMTSNTLSNDSASATVALAMNISRTIHATIGSQGGLSSLGNSFTNNTGIGLVVTSNANSARVNLDLQDNTATGGGAIDYQLNETLGVFGVVDRDDTLDTQINNTGTIDLGGKVYTDFTDISSVTQPD